MLLYKNLISSQLMFYKFNNTEHSIYKNNNNLIQKLNSLPIFILSLLKKNMNKTKIYILIILFTLFNINKLSSQNIFSEQLKEYIGFIEKAENSINTDRKNELLEISKYISDKAKNNKEFHPVFICTHNSRRSIFCEVWFWVASKYYNKSNLHPLSAGVDINTINPRTIEALRRAGLDIYKNDKINLNPPYAIILNTKKDVLIINSKKYELPMVYGKNYCEIMVCSEKEMSCPVFEQKTKRFSIPYTDLRTADNSSTEQKDYDARCKQIAAEMFFIVKNIR